MCSGWICCWCYRKDVFLRHEDLSSAVMTDWLLTHFPLYLAANLLSIKIELCLVSPVFTTGNWRSPHIKKSFASTFYFVFPHPNNSLSALCAIIKTRYPYLASPQAPPCKHQPLSQRRPGRGEGHTRSGSQRRRPEKIIWGKLSLN